MRLCDYEIEKLLNDGQLIIFPRPVTNMINGITVDIRLGNKFRIFREYTSAFIDLSQSDDEVNSYLNKIMSDEIQLKKQEVFFLHPKELVLALTLESITIPNNLVGWLDGRSSFARLGLMVHATAHRIDPGWEGKLVLEFYNSGKLPLLLRTGMTIGALSFESLSGPVARPYNNRKNAKYYKQNNVLIKFI